jgi:hypothetical protein
LKKKPKPGQTDRFRFGFLGQKLPVWLGFSGFGSVFSVLARVFFRFFIGFGLVFLVFWL